MVYVVNILLYKEYCIILLGLPTTAKSLVQRLKILNHTRMITVTVIPEGPQQTNFLRIVLTETSLQRVQEWWRANGARQRSTDNLFCPNEKMRTSRVQLHQFVLNCLIRRKGKNRGKIL